MGTVLFPLATASPVVAQESDGGHCPGKLEALNRSYVQQLREIERHWIADLADLTDGSSGCGADAAYRQLFNLAIEHDLCQEAKAAASFTASNGLAQRCQRQGLVILGVNVDHGYPDVSEAKTALPAAGRFYFRPGVHWINLLDCQAARKVTTAYGVEEHPAKFLIGRDGSVVAVEQSGDALERAIVRALGDPTGDHSRGSISRFNEASEFCSSDR